MTPHTIAGTKHVLSKATVLLHVRSALLFYDFLFERLQLLESDSGVGGGSMLVLFYETFAHDPYGTLARLIEFLGLPACAGRDHLRSIYDNAVAALAGSRWALHHGQCDWQSTFDAPTLKATADLISKAHPVVARRFATLRCGTSQ